MSKKKANNQVLLCLRKFLTEYNLEEIGEETLKNNFQMLDTLPWYSDERDDKDLTLHPWRYAFSHTLIVNKNNFNSVIGFDEAFGEQWGLEDIEFGYRLYERCCTFKYLKDCRVYHQPHFSQSSNEQKKVEPNQRLFIKLHNTFEAEIEICFCNFFDEYYQEIQNLRQRCKREINKHKSYNLIVGMVHSIGDNVKCKSKYRFGIVLPYENDSIEKVLISDNIYLFSPIIQRSILSESLRVAKKLYVKKNDSFPKEYIINLCSDISKKVELVEKNDVFEIKIVGRTNKSVMAIQLPDVLQPEKRFFYIWLASKLNKLGYLVYIEDAKKN